MRRSRRRWLEQPGKDASHRCRGPDRGARRLVLGTLQLSGRGRGAASRSTCGSTCVGSVRDGRVATVRVPGSRRSPRSRRAAGVGDVAGERGDRPPRLRGLQPPGLSMRSSHSTADIECASPFRRTGPRARCCVAVAGMRGLATSSPADSSHGEQSARVDDPATRATSWSATWAVARDASAQIEVAPCGVSTIARQDRPHRVLPRPRRSPRSRRAVGVGDVAGERGDRAREVRRAKPERIDGVFVRTIPTMSVDPAD